MENPVGVSDLWNGGGNNCEPNGEIKFEHKKAGIDACFLGLAGFR